MLGAELLPPAFWPRLRWPFSLVTTASESRLIRPAVKLRRKVHIEFNNRSYAVTRITGKLERGKDVKDLQIRP
jgi:hypothetical protein